MANCNYKVNIKDIQSKYSFKIFCSSDNAEIQAEIGNLEDLTTTAKNNLVSAINEVHSDTETNATAISGLQSGKEDKSNKVTSFSSTSTDTQYPSAKAVYDSQVTQDETISTLETNLEETQKELDYYKTIYNVLPKVEGNGESITLDNTGESILKLDTRGQCKQDNTTGKNLLNTTLATTTLNGITCTRNDDGTYKLNGTATAGTSFTLATPNPTLSAGTYKLVGIKGGSYSTFSLRAYNSGQSLLYVDIGSGVTFTTNESLAFQIFIDIANGTTLNNVIVKPMITTDTSLTYDDFEKYTGGQPSPSPDFPQQIHKVSGDNEINVEGKNLLDTSNVTGAGWNIYGIPNTLKPNTKYTFSIQGTTSFNYGLFTTSGVGSQTTITRLASYQSAGNSVTFTTPADMSNEKGLLLGGNGTGAGNESIDVIKPQIELGETKTDYEPYNGDTYELNLGVENLFGTSVLQGAVDINSVATSTTRLRTNDFIAVKPNTNYVCSFKGNANDYDIHCFTSNEFPRSSEIGWKSNGTYFTTPSTCNYIMITFRKSDNSTITTDDISNIQIEEGTKANSYSPFGQTPIKMRGIGTYEDYFVRNSGKNLIGLGTQLNGYRNGDTGNFQIHDTSIGYYFSTSDLPDTITISCINGNRANISYYNVLPQNGAASLDYSNSNTLPRTINVNKTYTYIHIQFSYNQAVSNIQVEKGSQATIYEPFGSGKWCKYNSIGKSTITSVLSVGTTTSGLKYAMVEDNPLTELYGEALCSKYAYNPTQTNRYNTIRIISGGIYIYDERFTDTTTALSYINGLDYYFQLKTPYLSLIENETLISQLDKVEKALGKDGQTNISQTNNDIPFKIYASALKEIE